MRVQIIDESRSGWSGPFCAKLTTQLSSLGTTPVISIRNQAKHATDPYEPTPSVCVYFAEGAPLSSHDAILSTYRNDGVPVFPVIKEASEAHLLPASLAELNAFLRDRHSIGCDDALVDEVLARVWLRRETRKLFISYKRSDSVLVARQLHARFTELGFEVFLDEVSIGRGANLEEEIQWRMNDVDVVVLLVSPNLEASRWVIDELSFANARSIGVVAVRWPNLASVVAQTLSPDQCIDLNASPSGTLADTDVEDVVQGVFERRAVAIKTRLDQLVPLADLALALHSGGAVTRTGLDEMVADRSTDRIYLRVLPHRPSPEQLYLVNDAGNRSASGFELDEVICFYPECDASRLPDTAARWLFESGRTPTHRLWMYRGTVPV